VTLAHLGVPRALPLQAVDDGRALGRDRLHLPTGLADLSSRRAADPAQPLCLAAGRRQAVIAIAAVMPARGWAPALPDDIKDVVSVPPNGIGWRVNECVLNDNTKASFAPGCIDQKRPLVILWGDSTAAALVPGFRKVQETHDFGLGQLTISSCPPLLVYAHSMSQLCLERNADVVKRIAQAKPDLVILHAIWDVNDKLESTKPTIDALRAAGVSRIIILGPVPVWRGGLPDATANYFYRHTRELIPERTKLFVDQISEIHKCVTWLPSSALNTSLPGMSSAMKMVV
jgi:SGNH domain (fused to AT3 domains)